MTNDQRDAPQVKMNHAFRRVAVRLAQSLVEHANEDLENGDATAAAPFYDAAADVVRLHDSLASNVSGGDAASRTDGQFVAQRDPLALVRHRMTHFAAMDAGGSTAAPPQGPSQPKP